LVKMEYSNCRGCCGFNSGNYDFGKDLNRVKNYNVDLGLDYKKLMGISGGDGGMVDYSVM